MPVVNFSQYVAMLDNAKKNKFAYPAVNVATMEQANAVLRAASKKRTDVIIEVTTGGGEFASGLSVKDSVIGAISLAEHIRLMAEQYDIYVALHTDHCPMSKLNSFLIPLIEESEKRVAAGQPPLFNSHMFDGGELSIKENLDVSVQLLERCAKCGIILEVETGVVGGEEDGVSHEDMPSEKLYTTPADMCEVYRRLSEVEDAKFLFAATFGNVHGSYKPGAVKLRPEILKQGQEAVVSKYGEEAQFYLVFHGGSGSEQAKIDESLEYGVIKMNIDTDTQYFFTRPIVDHVLKNYDAILKMEGEVGNKKIYDPRAYLKKAEEGMAHGVFKFIQALRCEGTTLFGKLREES